MGTTKNSKAFLKQVKKQIHKDVAGQASQLVSLQTSSVAAACTMMLWDMFKERKKELLAQQGKPEPGDKELLALATSGSTEKESGDD